MRENNRKSIARIGKLPQFTTMNVIDGQTVQGLYASLIFYSLTIDNILNIIVLLILAGVALSTLSGNGSIVENANKAVEKYNQTAGKDLEIIDVVGAKLEEYMIADYWDGTVNKPNLKEGMIPVKWNGTAWVKADKTNAGNDWYNYDKTEKKWANVVTVKEAGRANYMNAANGTVINMEDITTMFVWIPRYAYKITNDGYHANVNGTGNIEIEWLKGKTSITATGKPIVAYNATTTENYTKFPEGYVVHPAFKADTAMGGIGEEISGFWVGKFESSNYQMAENYENNEGLTNSSSSTLLYGQGDGANVTIKPNVTSWRAITTTSIYNVCQDMTKAGNIHGLGADTTTVMMQNSQWGAVAYLAQSDYGNKQMTGENGVTENSGIWNNSYNEGFTTPSESSEYKLSFYSTNMTGMAGSSRDENTSYYAHVIPDTKSVDNANGTVTISFNYRQITAGNRDKDILDTDGNAKVYRKTYYRYNTEIGQRASTTRNIYGVYDMSGGAWEYMASYLKDVQKTETGYKHDLVNNFNDLKSKYVTGYLGTSDNRINNYNANKHMYGDAVWETSNGASGQYSWNKDYSNFPYLACPFFARGGVYDVGENTGGFYFSFVYGGAYHHYGFRAVAL